MSHPDCGSSCPELTCFFAWLSPLLNSVVESMAQGDAAGCKALAAQARSLGKNNVAFAALFVLGDVEVGTRFPTPSSPRTLSSPND
jgi:hypothetical protein